MDDIFRKIPNRYKGRNVYWFDVNELVSRVPQPYNKELAEDIIENGMQYPLILKVTDEGNILVGNQRYTILKKLGIKKIPCIIFGSGYKVFQKRNERCIRRIKHLFDKE